MRIEIVNYTDSCVECAEKLRTNSLIEIEVGLLDNFRLCKGCAKELISNLTEAVNGED